MTPAQEKAAELAADSAWDFAANPPKLMGHVSVNAAENRWGNSAGQPDLARSRFWVEVSVALVALADNPSVEVGEVVHNLAREFGIPVA